MMHRSYKLLLLALAMVLSLPVGLGAISEVGMLSLTIEPGARASSMGRAFSAIADDAYAPWWNPGATAFNRKNQIALTHMPWLQTSDINDMFYEYLGYNKYFEGIGNMNVHLVMFNTGSQEQMDEQGQPLGEFSTYDIAGAVGYSYEVIPAALGVGANFKLFYSYLGPGTGETDADKGDAFGFAFDLGAKYKNMGLKGLDGALVIQNIGPDITYQDPSQSDPMPITFRLSAAYTAVDNPAGKLQFSAEASKFLSKDVGLLQRFFTGWGDFAETIYGVGAEYTYMNLIALRGGYFVDDVGEIVGPSFGAGLQYTWNNLYKFSVDFGMITAGELSDFNKVFSLGIEF